MSSTGGQPLDVRELAALYAAGAVTPEERALVERLVREGDRELADELARLSGAMGALAGSEAEVQPPAHVRERVLAHAERHRPAEPPILTLRAGEGTWVELGSPRVKARVLLSDPTIQRQTILIKMEPNTDYPDHHHHGLEECYVVEGDLHIAGVTLRAGDYQRCLGGTDHGPSYTVGGCTLLITVPLAA